ncbi:MAG: cobalt-zinc-cadmium efflux system outer membrane protein [Kiritimatiellia bacterium]|jgi:cobalt-zinc-cadmium efflux system outer membrane protein
MLLGAAVLHAEEATLSNLWHAVEQNHPRIKATLEIQRANIFEEGRAATWQNPEISVEGENLGGDLPGTDQAEWTLSLAQPIEWPGRRSRRLRAARIQRTYDDSKVHVIILSLAKDFSRDFYETLALQEQVRLQMEALEQAHAFVRMAELRVEAGKSTVLEVNKAKMEQIQLEIHLQDAQKTLLNALTEMGKRAGLRTAPEVLEGDLYRLPEVPDRNHIHSALYYESFDHLERKRSLHLWELSIAEAEKAWIPDLILSAGVRQNEADDAQSYLGSLGLDIPLWNRGNYDKGLAKARVKEAQLEKALADQELQLATTKRENELNLQRQRILRYRNDLIPLLKHHARQAEQSYREGWIGYLEYLEARNDYLEVQFEYLDALKTYHIDERSIRSIAEKQAQLGSNFYEANTAPSDDIHALKGQPVQYHAIRPNPEKTHEN